jgi:3'(2'), 5'-bisphosphate nucleotidase
MSHAYKRELQVALPAVVQAMMLCRAVQVGITPDVLAKRDRSPVTVADFGSQALVCHALHETYPCDPIVAEEDSADLQKQQNVAILDQVLERVSAQKPGVDRRVICNWIDRGRSRSFSNRFWTLDPIDGTKGFLRGEQYAVAVALIIDGSVAVGVLGCPNLPFDESTDGGTIFFAVCGHGTRAMPAHGSPNSAVPVRVSTQRDALSARFCESIESGHSSHGDAAIIAQRVGIVRAPLRMDSQAKYAVVARGDAEIYLRLPTRADYQEKIWDHAAGVLIVVEAGGRVTDVSGKPLDFSHGPELVANRGVIVSNGLWHDRILAALASVP